MRIKDLEVTQRPREKAIRYGIKSLDSYELLALIIGSGVKNISALDIANKILSKFSLSSIDQIDYGTLKKIKGLNDATILRLLGAIELHKRISRLDSHNIKKVAKTSDIVDMYYDELKSLDHEIMVIVMVNYHNHIIHEEILAKGSSNFTAFEASELFKLILNFNAKKFYLIHNHPSGNCEPSFNDLDTTYHLKRLAKDVGIKFIDHLIITYDNYYSFKENNLI